jgi:lipoprotein-anchoring transpeptidase ErfK/SrfK
VAPPASTPDVVKTSGQGEKTEVVIVVSKAERSLVVESGGRVVLHAPVTVGSEHDPLPIGEWAVTGLHPNPVFHYNPDLFWDADPSHAKAKIQPGPNNPVGVMWIDLTREHYGLHGTPEPGRVGHTASHGCVRLTNWDVERVAAYVRKGTRVVFKE